MTLDDWFAIVVTPKRDDDAVSMFAVWLQDEVDDRDAADAMRYLVANARWPYVSDWHAHAYAYWSDASSWPGEDDGDELPGRFVARADGRLIRFEAATGQQATRAALEWFIERFRVVGRG